MFLLDKDSPWLALGMVKAASPWHLLSARKLSLCALLQWSLRGLSNHLTMPVFIYIKLELVWSMIGQLPG